MGNRKYKASIENNIHFDEFTFGEVQDCVFNWYFFYPSGKPKALHLLRCQGSAVKYYSFILEDSTVNAIILLDLFAKTLPPVIEESLEEIRQIHEPFLKQFI